MHDYRAYVIGQDGRVLRRIDFLADDDEKAEQQATKYLDGHDVELWQRDRKISTLKASR